MEELLDMEHELVWRFYLPFEGDRGGMSATIVLASSLSEAIEEAFESAHSLAHLLDGGGDFGISLSDTAFDVATMESVECGVCGEEIRHEGDDFDIRLAAFLAAHSPHQEE